MEPDQILPHFHALLHPLSLAEPDSHMKSVRVWLRKTIHH